MSSEHNNMVRRQEQVFRWADSETDRASAVIRESDKITFTKEVQLLSACNNNDWHEIARLLGDGVDINSTQDDGLTALHQACIDDDEPLVKYLIEKGADTDAQDKEGWTPLFAAISCNYLPITKYLISCGAQLDIVSFDGELPLDQANNEAISSFIKEEMTKRNLDPEEIRNRERNILLNDVDSMKKTKDFSKFTLVDNGGSLLHIAASKDYIDVLERLIEIISPQLLNHTDNDGWTALHVAAHWGNRKACVLLINADIDFDKITSSNQSVLEVSDDDVKPYIREEIRKARFRRQDRLSVKRPAESSNAEFQPKYTKIICHDNISASPVDNAKQPNGDKHVTVLIDHQSAESLSDIYTPIPVSGRVVKSGTSFDNNLKTADAAQESVANPVNFQDDSSITKPASPAVILPENSNEHVKSDVSTTSNDAKSSKAAVLILSISKTAESESQRKDKARHVRSTRRSTQGVTAEDIEEAKKMKSPDKQNIIESLPINTENVILDTNHSIDNECALLKKMNESESGNKIQFTNNPLNGTSLIHKEVDPSKSVIDSMDHLECKVKATSHVLNKRRTRERPPTGIVDIKDIQTAYKELTNLDNNTLSNSGNKNEERDIDYKILYEKELKENEKLQQNMAKICRDLDESLEQIKMLKNNHVVPILQTQTYAIIPSLYEMKDIEKLREENKKMKDANSALIRVISRLSHPSPKSLAGSN